MEIDLGREAVGSVGVISHDDIYRYVAVAA